MKILHININYMYSNKVHRTLKKKLDDSGIENIVFSPMCPGENYVENNDEDVIACECFKKNDRLFFFKKQKKILKALKDNVCINDIDCVHAYTVFSDGNIAYELKKQFGIPYVVAVRNTDINTFFKYMIHLRSRGVKILENASAVFFLSQTYKDKLFQKYLTSDQRKKLESKTFIIPNGVDEFWLDNLCQNPNIIDEKKIRICFAGRIDPNKNCDTAIKACETLVKHGYDVEYTLVGRLLDKKIEQQINTCSFIKYIPHVSKEELIEIYRSNDVFLMPSFRETFGIAYVEAMSQGLPVVYTKGEGFDGQFAEGKVGYHVDSSSSDDIVHAIKKIVSDYERIRHNCIENSKKFDWNKINRKYIEIYRKSKA